MKTILCYGDSNTWGSQGQGARMPHEQQWPHILKKLLGDDFYVVQEGLGGRVAGSFEHDDPAKNGKDSFEVIYRSAAPVDLVIIGLGANDLKTKYGQSAEDIFSNLMWYVAKTEELKGRNYVVVPKIMYVTPANFDADKNYYDADEAVRQELIQKLEASGYPVIILNSMELAGDKLHFTEADHQKIAKLVVEKVKELGL
ncbi:MAG: hypothetical protein JWO47_119 [Candidatus Saccharibacteria bacterium]|nr:hypothetical protein [Candidatus Saccharibacteria bacterium]